MVRNTEHRGPEELSSWGRIERVPVSLSWVRGSEKGWWLPQVARIRHRLT